MGRLNKYGDKKQVGGGLSLEKFAGAKVSKYNKQQVQEKLQEEKLRRRSKYKKLKHKLEGEGKLTIGGFEVVDNGAQIEAAVPHAKSPEDGQNHASLYACMCGYWRSEPCAVSLDLPARAGICLLLPAVGALEDDMVSPEFRAALEAQKQQKSQQQQQRKRQAAGEEAHIEGEFRLQSPSYQAPVCLPQGSCPTDPCTTCR